MFDPFTEEPSITLTVTAFELGALVALIDNTVTEKPTTKLFFGALQSRIEAITEQMYKDEFGPKYTGPLQ